MQSDMRVINEMVQQESAFVDNVTQEVQKVIVGQTYMIHRTLLALLTGGHILLEGVPGLAKTLTVNTLSKTIKTQFQRIQFTPDLLPADLVGTQIYNQQTGDFSVKKGPIFSNLVLADEINRAPAKVQAALLEAMQEKQVTIGDTTFALQEPFVVMATQNPIEQEGTYPLPEAQVDRFMLMVKVDYPTRDEELQIMDRMSVARTTPLQEVVSPEQILDARKVVEQIYMDPKIKEYIVDLILATRKPDEYGLSSLKHYIDCGASPRASIYLSRAAKGHAFMNHRGYVIPEDIKSVGADILRHRVSLSYEAEADEVQVEDVLQSIFEGVAVP